jgi:hypothetical protein
LLKRKKGGGEQPSPDFALLPKSNYCILTTEQEYLKEKHLSWERTWENDSSGHKKYLQRKILIARMDTCPEGSMWQDPAFV